ncbi:acyl carrier protein [Mesorhizobium sp. UC22_110]|jgi:acyl carrier protein|uniref:acyl carrier protein n=1 Tax=unclassified Mesorhizobium TaxID=325217 RepID=UPI00366BC649
MTKTLSAADTEKLTTVFHDIFGDSKLQIARETTAADVAGWDSFNHINLMMMVEGEFGIRFKTSEITHLKNVGELMDLIASKLN